MLESPESKKQDPLPPGLYVVATPIGNMEDFSQRAISTLSRVDLVLCEDTRSWRRLSSRFDLSNKFQSYHNYNEISRTEQLIGDLKEGSAIAIVSDAGTPAISDPGYRIIKACHENNIKVSPIPGPSAVIAALSASGLELNEFQFLGFAPVKSGKRQKLVERALASEMTSVFYESPHKLLKTLAVIKDLEATRSIVIAREISKKFEEITRGSAEAMYDDYSARKSIKGEFVIIVSRIVPRKNSEKSKSKDSQKN